jgi:hypothetical protein
MLVRFGSLTMEGPSSSAVPVWFELRGGDLKMGRSSRFSGYVQGSGPPGRRISRDPGSRYVWITFRPEESTLATN